MAQVTVNVAAYSPALGKGFPNVTALLQQERASPAKLQLGGFQEYNNSPLLGEGFPSESVTALLCFPPSPA